MLLNRMAGLALRVTNINACSPSFLAEGRATLQHHARTLPTANARRQLTVRAGTKQHAWAYTSSSSHAPLLAKHQSLKQFAATPRRCLYSQSHKHLRLRSTQSGPSVVSAVRTNAGLADCDCGCNTGRAALSKPFWCVKFDKRRFAKSCKLYIQPRIT